MKSSAGTYESSDCLITITKNNVIDISIDSIVLEQFGDQIKKVIQDTLLEHNIQNVKVTCFDKGALDYTIKSRLETALKRGGYIE